ncbi:hypothetical protein C5167_013413 [Papaver somniferum]|uniref:Uncharacterized protein n=1 Tax=Papaver somniferum TaxID=3469 RepID=A0A4Y7J4H6_PAPSO|nr:hypothetical protein C5167_013413 [Papaver somniferum]
MDMAGWNEYVEKEKLKEKDEFYAKKGREFISLLQEDGEWTGFVELEKWPSYDEKTKGKIATDLKDYFRLIHEDYSLKRWPFAEQLEEKQGYL